MASDYLLQIIHKHDGMVVGCAWEPGLAVEVALIDDLVARVEAKGVGVGRTEAHVLADVRAAMTELLVALKTKV